MAQDEMQWYYKDSTGQEFGPYTSSTMRGWFRQGFFPMRGELQVRREGDPSEDCHFIKDLYNEPLDQNAFNGLPLMPGAQGKRRGGGRGGGPKASAAPQPQMPQMDPYGFAAPQMAGQMDTYLAMMQNMSPGLGGMPFPQASRSPMLGMMPGMPGIPGMSGGMMMPMAGMDGTLGTFTGRVKSFNAQKGFGFIECPATHQMYGRDVFLHKAQAEGLKQGDVVQFRVEKNKNDHPQARDVMPVGDMATYSMMMGGMAPVGMTAGRGSKGGGKGKKQGGQKKGGADNKKKPQAKAAGGGAGGSTSPPKEPSAEPQIVSA